jgi:hypothetical protein
MADPALSRCVSAKSVIGGKTSASLGYRQKIARAFGGQASL